MNFFDKNRILAIAVVALLIINIALLAFLWTNRPPKPPFPPDRERGEKMDKDRMQKDGRPEDPGFDKKIPAPGGPKEFLKHELNFTDKQNQDYEKLIEQHQSDIRAIREKMMKDRDNFWNGLSATKGDSVNISASIIGEDQKQLELVTFNHFKKVRDLCTDDQKKKFDKVINDALRMMAGPGGPPPGGPEHDGPPKGMPPPRP